MTVEAPQIVWFRNDLRLADHPAVAAAIEQKRPIIPLWIWSAKHESHWPTASASRWWLHHSLKSLDEGLHRLQSRLLLRIGEPLQVLQKLIRETGAATVLWNHVYEPANVTRDAAIKAELNSAGIEVQTFNGNLLHEPWEVQTGGKTPYKVFTPFSRACLARGEPLEPRPRPRTLRSPAQWPTSDSLSDLKLLPTIPWDAGFHDAWSPGEAGAHRVLKRFLNHVREYKEERDRPDHEGTSRLSPYLHFGELSPRQIWHAVLDEFGPNRSGGGEPYLRQLLWREFAYHLLYHFPQTTDEPLRSEFARFPWQRDRDRLIAWQKGLTGYPYIDAGMRQLWKTGWMHNRVRMAVGSFLVKDLLLPWQEGAKWFWDTLVDADLANNTLGWQWIAGCGADAAPYFRIFNPLTQAQKFDPEGDYVRAWVPELARLPADWIHEPAAAPSSVLEDAGVELGKTYPRPIVDHAEARKDALSALQQMVESREK